MDAGTCHGRGEGTALGEGGGLGAEAVSACGVM
jgi:hypothetical protein